MPCPILLLFCFRGSSSSLPDGEVAGDSKKGVEISTQTAAGTCVEHRSMGDFLAGPVLARPSLNVLDLILWRV